MFPRILLPLAGVVLLLVSAGLSSFAADPTKPMDEPRVAVAKGLGSDGILVQRPADKPWQRVGPKDDVFSKDLTVVLPGTRVELASKNDAVKLMLWGNLPQLSSYPVLDCRVTLHPPGERDLDLTLHGGRLTLTNARDQGPARVALRFGSDTAEVVLPEKGDAVALEQYGRWPRGVLFTVAATTPD